MPLTDMPFKWVAGHRYILTLVDYTTRYPEAVPLNKINTKAVAEALLNIYSKVDIPKEVSPIKLLRFCPNASRKYPVYSA